MTTKKTAHEKSVSLENIQKKLYEEIGTLDPSTKRKTGITTEFKKLSSVIKSKDTQRNVNMAQSVEELLEKLTTSVGEAVGGASRNDYKTLPPLPYFNGELQKLHGNSSKEPWILYNCQDFLQMIENAVKTDKWTEAGKIRTLQDKLIGVARMYWEDREADVDTFEKAKTYMLERFPNTETYTTINRQIIEFKRKPGEAISAMACRIQTLYNKLGKVAQETEASKSRNMKELFLNNLPEVIRDQVLDADSFNKVLEKSLSYLERHKELKLRAQDIQLELSFRTEGKINNITVPNKPSGENAKKKNSINQNNTKETQRNLSKQPQRINNMNQTNTSSNFNQRGNRTNFRTNFGPRNQYRNQYRGRIFDRGQGNIYNYRGQGNTYRRNYRSTFRNRGFQRGTRFFYRNTNPFYRNQYYQNTNHNNYSSREPKCTNCGRYGHFARVCNTRNQNVNGRFNGTSNNQTNNSCWTCGSTTHISRNCPQKN